MRLRTPRRRISPYTKQKYQAIKKFLRRALGNSSQECASSKGDDLTNSNIEVSVTDLKHKIEGLEQQLERVSKHCQDIESLENIFWKESEILETRRNFDIRTVQKPVKSNKNIKNVETELLYHDLNDEYRKRAKLDKGNSYSHDKNGMPSFEPSFSKNASDLQFKTKTRKHRKFNETKENRDRRDNVKTKYNIVSPPFSASSFHSLLEPKQDCANPGFSGHRQRQHKKGYDGVFGPVEYRDREMIGKDSLNKHGTYEREKKNRRNKHEISGFNEDFIADIIEKQYKPVKLFGKRHSDFSQFSAPVCRDQEFSIRREIQDDTELCSCCFDEDRNQKHRFIRSSDLSDMRSICDTRLYSSKRHRSHKKYRCVADYNNSALYDVVPVKEKSSPKSRRKFAEDNRIAYSKEVPPSPRTHRPRLNLKVQNYTNYEDSLVNVRHRGRKNYKETPDTHESDFSRESHQPQIRQNSSTKVKAQKSTQIQQEAETASNLQVHNFITEPINISNNNTALNTRETDSSAFKTDKALGEIKDILQSFLLEMKKESTLGVKPNVTSKAEDNTMNQKNIEINTNTIPSNGHNYNLSVGQCNVPPFLPTFPSPCCYPIIPMCPMNCLQSGYILPNPSLTCTCAKHSKENICPEKECSNSKSKTSETKPNNETQELIKEIYKFVSHNPKSPRNIECSRNELRNLDKSLLINRSVGSKTRAFKHDANVGTPNKCYSKSCEAIGSRIPSDACYTTNTSYSETVLEKLSVEATRSSTDSDVSSDVPTRKDKRSTFKKVLRSLRLFRKKKHAIEELSESEDTVVADVKSKPPFKQQITNYAVHGQEYFHPPPVPNQHFCPPHSNKHSHGYDQRNHRNMQYPIRCELSDYRGQNYDSTVPPGINPASYLPKPVYPNYDPHHDHLQPHQMPLCLKEIEVKSIGTQSERKMTVFSKFMKRNQPAVQQGTNQQYNTSPPVQTTKPTIWKSLQEKAKQQNTDPMTYSLKTQNQLAQGDMKLRNAMLKKLFYKRNPFSPRNLIVRTLLGKDKSSFGDPPKMYRPRMFL